MLEERSDDETWSNPLHIIPMKAGYDWRRYARSGPYFLCLDGRPVEVQGKLGNWWRACTFQPAGGEVEVFANAMRSE